MFDDMMDKDITHAPPTSLSSAAQELTGYLSAPVDPAVRDPLKWWWDHRYEYPHLSRMARDYLSIPGEFTSECLCLLFTFSMIQ
jgi:hypothetical protein